MLFPAFSLNLITIFLFLTILSRNRSTKGMRANTLARMAAIAIWGARKVLILPLALHLVNLVQIKSASLHLRKLFISRTIAHHLLTSATRAPLRLPKTPTQGMRLKTNRRPSPSLTCSLTLLLTNASVFTSSGIDTVRGLCASFRSVKVIEHVIYTIPDEHEFVSTKVRMVVEALPAVFAQFGIKFLFSLISSSEGR